MSLQTIKHLEKSEALALPPLRFYSVLVVLILILLFKYFIHRVKVKILGPVPVQTSQTNQSLSRKYIYHLALILVILPDISWNLFDFAVWVFSYVGVGIVRNLFYDIENEKTEMLNGMLLEKKFEILLSQSEKVSAITLALALLYISLANWCFAQASSNPNPVLLYPTVLLALDCLYTLASCKLIKNSIANFFNNNVDCQTPRFKLQTSHSALTHILNIYHFSQLAKILYKTTLTFAQLASSIYAISILKQIYQACRDLINCLVTYQRFADSISQMNRYLPEGKGDIEAECPICQQELESCRVIRQCGHKFHFKCIFDWVKSKESPVCPVCRGVIIRSRYIRRDYERGQE